MLAAEWNVPKTAHKEDIDSGVSRVVDFTTLQFNPAIINYGHLQSRKIGASLLDFCSKHQGMCFECFDQDTYFRCDTFAANTVSCLNKQRSSNFSHQSSLIL
jgi:hypothetical protein